MTQSTTGNGDDNDCDNNDSTNNNKLLKDVDKVFKE